MRADAYRSKLEPLFASAGVRLDGPNRWDIQVHDPDFYRRVLGHGSLGFGESYMEGGWDAEDLDGLLFRLLKAELDDRDHSWDTLLMALHARFFNEQRRSKAFEVGERHYDLDESLYRATLGPRLIYSCGYWKDAKDLACAEEAKLELVYRKLGLKPGMRVLDIGCGWGAGLKLAAERYGITGVGITISEEQ